MIVDKGFRSSIDFPDPRRAWTDGLVTIGGSLDVGTLYHAYWRGIFPWPQDGLPMLWFCPEQRGILFFKDLHVPKRLQRSLEKDAALRYTMNEAFEQVVRACQQQPRPGQQGTWILPEVLEAYVNFHRAGFARSFEVWRDEQLVGGMYGVCVEGVFSGESMFHRESDASKKALIFAAEQLRSEGFEWIDTQMVTPVVEALGGKLISRADYLRLMKESQRRWEVLRW